MLQTTSVVVTMLPNLRQSTELEELLRAQFEFHAPVAVLLSVQRCPDDSLIEHDYMLQLSLLFLLWRNEHCKLDRYIVRERSV